MTHSHEADSLHLFDLASEALGGAVLWANDEFFAEKENLLRETEPVWKEDAYTDRGKWMDGWESRRRRTPGNDSCIVRLGVAGTIERVVVDTAFFRGNFPESCSVEGCSMPENASPEELLAHDEWVELLPQSQLQGHHKNTFELSNRRRFTHLRLQIYPDGGVARFRVFGNPVPDQRRTSGTIDLVGVLNGGSALAQSDMFFGLSKNLLKPERGKNMGDGWETKRRRGPGHDWVMLLLAEEGVVEWAEVDTHHFKGNYPDRFSLELYDQEPREPALVNAVTTVIKERPLQAHTRHTFDVSHENPCTHVVLRIFPDGGISRLRLWGRLTDRGHAGVALRYLNGMHDRAAFDVFRSCCGSSKWASAMMEALPFASPEALLATSDELWRSVEDEDRLEAFAAHPRIGEKKDAGPDGAQFAQWSDGEQAAASTEDAAVKARLAELNEQYFDEHGFIFIICATGKSADEVLASLETRVENSAAAEVVNAAREQALITKLRLNKWLQSPSLPGT